MLLLGRGAFMVEKIPDLSNEWDKTRLKTVMENARRLKRDDVYKLAVRQLCRVEGRNIEDPLEAEFAIVMRALEEALTEESGRTKRLNRTRQKLDRAGVHKTLSDLALTPKPSTGFLKLVEFNMADMSAEALVLKFRKRFAQAVVEAAKRRLEEYKVPLPTDVDP
jgi:hypothetical protein